MSMKTQRSALLALGLGAGMLATAIGPSLAAGIDEPFRAGYHEALNGKKVVFIPVAQAVDLAQGWFATMKKELEPLGVSVTVRDPNFNSSAGAQAIENLINEKPAVMVVQNPDVQTYAKLLQRAEQAGIFVIQLNMRTSYNSTAFVGVDWVEMGEKLTQSVVKACEGKSGKIAILAGRPLGRRQRIHPQRHRERAGKELAALRRIQSGGGLGFVKGESDYADCSKAASGSCAALSGFGTVRTSGRQRQSKRLA